MEFQQEHLVELRLTGTGNRPGLEPLTPEVDVETEVGADFLTWKRVSILEMFQKGLATVHMQVKIAPAWVQVGWSKENGNHALFCASSLLLSVKCKSPVSYY